MTQHVALSPKLVVRGADQAIAFYQEAFGATTVQRFVMGDLVVFALLDLWGHAVELKDEDEHDPSPATLGHPGVVLSVTTDDPDGVADAAVRAGATVVFPVADQPYGSRAGRVRDPFGHEWLVQTPVTLSPAEVQESLDGA